jgi:hypothetical protein
MADLKTEIRKELEELVEEGKRVRVRRLGGVTAVIER